MVYPNHRPELTDSLVKSLQPKEKPYEITDPLRKGLIVRVEKSGRKTWWLHLWTPEGAPKRERYRWKIGDSSTYKLYRNTPSRKSDRARSVRDVAEDIIARAREVDLRVEKRAAIAAQDSEKAATLRNFIDLKYLDYYRGERRARPDQTIKWLKSAFSDMLDMRMDAITHLTIRKWQSESLKTRKPATIQRLLGTLSGVLSHAISEGIIEKHPLQAKERHRSTTRLKIVKATRKPPRYLSPNEEKRLRGALSARDKEMKSARARTIAHREARNLEPPKAITGAYFDHLTPLVLLALNTGIRRGGLLGLRWDDIKNGQILVRASLDKAKKGYHVPLSREASEVLRLWKRQTSGSGLVFKHQGKRIKSIKTSWSGLMKRAGIQNFRYHDLRHSFASKLAMAGIDLFTIKELLGHQNIEMTQIYSHLSPDHMKAALEALDR